MPKTPTDYSKTIIYKIQSIDNPELLYVGSTTDFTKRKYAHKSCCNNPNLTGYNYKLYQMIRENGNWDMFNMIELYKFPCNNRREAEYEEDRCIREMKSSLNTTRAYSTPEEKQEQTKQWRLEHKDELVEYKKQYYKNHIDKITQQQKQYYTEHKDKIAERTKQYYIEHKDEITEYKKQWGLENKDKIAERQKQWRLENKDHIKQYKLENKERDKQWRLENKDKLAENKKQYYLEHKEQIAEQRKQKITCECGCIVTNRHLERHKRSKKHQDLINSSEK